MKKHAIFLVGAVMAGMLAFGAAPSLAGETSVGGGTSPDAAGSSSDTVGEAPAPLKRPSMVPT